MAGSVVEDFVRRTSRSYRVRRVVADGLRTAIAIAIVVACVAVAAPSWWPHAAGIGSFLLAVLVGLRWRSLGFDVVEADRHFGLRGSLMTWVETRSSRGGAGMRGWLERDLGRRLEDLPVERLEQLGRRRLGPARSALVLLLVLLLLRLLVLPPFPEGVVELAGRTASMGAAGGGGGEEPETKPDPEQPPDEVDPPEDAESPPDEPSPDEPPPDEPPPQEPGDEGDELPPEALLMEPPVRDEFVVPSFVGAGEGRTTTAPAAGIDEVRGQEDTPSAAAGVAGGGGDEEPEVEPEIDFERALEAALRSRHVPDHERPFVRRWFRSLLDDGR